MVSLSIWVTSLASVHTSLLNRSAFFMVNISFKKTEIRNQDDRQNIQPRFAITKLKLLNLHMNSQIYFSRDKTCSKICLQRVADISLTDSSLPKHRDVLCSPF